MNRFEAKELVKKYPICLIYKENGEDVRFNLFEYAIEIEKEIERLKEDLKKYGRHSEICEAKWKHRGGIQAKCTCGLQQALKDK